MNLSNLWFVAPRDLQFNCDDIPDTQNDYNEEVNIYFLSDIERSDRMLSNLEEDNLFFSITYSNSVVDSDGNIIKYLKISMHEAENQTSGVIFFNKSYGNHQTESISGFDVNENNLCIQLHENWQLNYFAICDVLKSTPFQNINSWLDKCYFIKERPNYL